MSASAWFRYHTHFADGAPRVDAAVGACGAVALPSPRTGRAGGGRRGAVERSTARRNTARPLGAADVVSVREAATGAMAEVVWQGSDRALDQDIEELMPEGP